MKQIKLRFPEFVDDWKPYKVSEITNFHKQGFYTTEDYCNDKKYYLLRGTDLSNNRLQLNDTPKINATEKDYQAFKVKTGDFLVVRSGTVGTYGIVYQEIPAIFGSYLINFRFDHSKVKNEFFGYFYQSDLFKRQLNKIIQQSANTNINAENIKSTIIQLPSLNEQQKITSLFSELDTLIQSAEKELEGYRELKQGMLQKMFPKKGEKVPEIRFPEFTDDWEQRKFGEVLETVTDYVAAGSFADLAKNVEYKDYPDYAQLIRTMDLKNGFTSAQKVYVNKNAFDYLHRVNMDKECIILPNIGNCGEVYYVKPESLPYKHNVLGPNAIFVRSETCANNFLSILFQAKDFQTKLKLIVSPNGQTKFNKTELKGIDLILPSNVYEQEKIGQYFENLDNLIALQQKELDGYKELKKGLLQQMFC